MLDIYFGCLIVLVICSDIILIRMIRTDEKKEAEDVRMLIISWERSADILMTVDEEINKTLEEIMRKLTKKEVIT